MIRNKKGQFTSEARADKHYMWRGGKYVDSRGRVWYYLPEHPSCNSRKYVAEHRLVMEKKLGRYLKSSEIVHHIDGNSSNNDPTNLVITSRKEHPHLHGSLSEEHRKKIGLGVRKHYATKTDRT